MSHGKPPLLSQLTKSPELNINCELDKSVLPSYSSLYMDYFSTANPSSSEFSSVANSSKEKKIKGGKRSKGVKLSTDPQSVAARERRHRISDRFKILQSLVPGGSKMDTVSMLEEAIHYVKFLKTQIWLHQTMINFVDEDPSCFLAASFPSHDQQNFYAENSTLVDQVQPSSPPLPLPNAYFQSEETISLDPYVKY